MKKILIRTATGLVYIALILIATLCGPYAFLSIFSIIAALGIAEMLKLCTKDEKPSVATTVIDILGGDGFFHSVFFTLFPRFFCNQSTMGRHRIHASARHNAALRQAPQCHPPTKCVIYGHVSCRLSIVIAQQTVS